MNHSLQNKSIGILSICLSLFLTSFFTINTARANAFCSIDAGFKTENNCAMDMSQWVNCPPAWINVSCSQLDPGLNYGSPTIGYGCGCGPIIYGPYIQDNRVGCGAGTIIKTWNIWTMYGEFTCCQTINVTGGYYGYPQIYWPPDYTITGCAGGVEPDNLPPPYNRPTWHAPECSNLMYTWKDEVYYPHDGNGICKKILRKWKVIDWCTYDVDHPWLGGYWTCTQLIKIMDQYPPTLTCPGDIVADAGPNCSGSYVHIPPAYAHDPCGYVHISNNSPYDIYGGADASGYYPPGVTHVTFCATDACGNNDYCTIKVTVTDKKKPSPVVFHGLSTNLMCMWPEPMIELNAKLFDAGSFDNCTPKHKLKFSINPKRFTCEDRGYNDVWFTVTDEYGNSETVKTYVLITDNSECCGPDTTNPPDIVCPDDIVFDALTDNCTGDYVQIAPVTATSECAGAITITNNSAYADSNGPDASGTYPVGTTVVTFTARDKCNKTSTCKVSITVRDGKKPTPVVHHGLAVSLSHDTVNNSGIITLVPEWFDAGSFDNCTASEDLVFSIEPSVFDCDSLGEREIIFTVTDESGNTEYVKTYVVIQDLGEYCGSFFAAHVAGQIVTENGDKISGVDMSAITTDTTYLKSVDGDYVLLDLAGGKPYDIMPGKVDNLYNGISTKDLLILKDHILGKNVMHSPYKLIAADVDGNKNINALDLITLRKVVIGLESVLPEGKSWKFIDGQFVFDPFTPALQQDYPSMVKINKLSKDMDDISFIGVKLGDLNGNVVANYGNSGINTRANYNTKFYAISNEPTSRTVRFDVRPETIMDVEGMQMAIKFNSAELKFQGLSSETISKFSSDIQLNTSKLNQGILIFNWVSENPVLIDPMDVMFTFSFEKLTETIEPELAIDYFSLSSELYDRNDNIYNIEIVNEKALSADGFSLFQNRPNPLQTQTTIGFNLPEESDVELSIFNLNGQLVKTVNGKYPKGTNNVVLTMEVPSGIYSYVLKAGNHVAVKKMIVIN